MTQKLLSIGTYGLHLMQYPSGRWGYVGTIPEVLTRTYKNKLGLPVTDSKVFETKEEAMKCFEENKESILNP